MNRKAPTIAVASAFVCLIAVATSASATQLKEARVTQVVNDVKLLLQQAAPRPATVSDLVRYGTRFFFRYRKAPTARQWLLSR